MFTPEIISALMVFAFATSITPGPNNLMLLASGANFGWARTFPHMIGISGGFLLLTFLAGVGLSKVFDYFPWAYIALRTISILFLLYLAFKIATAAAPTNQDGAAKGTPLSFMQAAAFQWVNPKAWTMALTAIATYTPADTGMWGAAVVAMVFAAVNFPSINVWVFLGTQMRVLLNVPWKLRAFNVGAAILLLASLYPILFPSA